MTCRATVQGMDPVTKNLRALQGALEHSLTIQRTKVQEIIDDLVSRGTLSRTDADGLLGQLLASSKDYSQALLQGYVAPQGFLSRFGRRHEQVSRLLQPALPAGLVAESFERPDGV